MTQTIHKIIDIILRPWLISLVFTIIFGYFFIALIPNYNVNKEIIGYLDNAAGFVVFDLEQDGNYEYAFVRNHDFRNQNLVPIAIYNSSRKSIDDLVIRGEFNPYSSLSAFDTDEDGITEVFAFYYRSDSLFVTSVEYHNMQYQERKSCFIASVAEVKGVRDVVVQKCAFTDLDHDGHIDFIFSLGAGYCLQPRGIYSWTPETGQLRRSPGNAIKPHTNVPPEIIADSMGNTFILVSNTAPQNYVNENNPFQDLPYHDTIAYMYLLNDTLGYAIQPFPVQNMLFHPAYDQHKNEILFLEELDNSETEYLTIVDLQGNEVRECPPFTYPVQAGGRGSLSFAPNSDRLLISRTGMLYQLPMGYCEAPLGISDLSLPFNLTIDICGDRDNELFSITGNSRFSILDRNYNIIQEFEAPLEGMFKSFSVFNGREGLIPFVSTTKCLLTFSLETIGIYKWRWIIIVGVFILFYFVFLGIRNSQKRQLQRRQEQEKETLQLQLQAIKNQVDPHFAMNAMNSVLYYFEHEQKEDARSFLNRYAKLMQNLLMNSDKVVSTLADELEFVRTYLDLEKRRPESNWDYSIEIEDQRLLTMQFPRTLIHTYVENAVKYAMRGHKDSGLLTIKIAQNKNEVIIEITDNGSGLENTQNNKRKSTRKGMKIGLRIAYLFEALTSKKVQVDFPADSSVQGTKVLISIGK